MKLSANISQAGFINDLANRTTDLAGYGYFPGKFGAVSVVLSDSKVSPYFWDEFNNKYYNFPHPLTALKSRFVLITTPNLAMRSISVSRSKTHEILGIVRISATGDSFQVMWGFYRQKINVTSIYKQLLASNQALMHNANNTMVTYVSPNYLQHLSYSYDEAQDAKMTRDLWISFPHLVSLTKHGIGLVDPNLHEEPEFIKLFGQKVSEHNVVVLKTQGVFIAGDSWDELLGLATTLDRAAQSVLTVNQTKTFNDDQYFEKVLHHKPKLSEETANWLKEGNKK